MAGCLGLTYSEFDNIVGPRLLYCYPTDAISRSNFEVLSDYVIVGKHLCGKVIAIKTETLQYINYPVAIDNIKYERNSLLYSFGFILDKDTKKEPFEPLLKKIATLFLSLELDREYLFNEATKSRIQILIEVIYKQLIENNEVFVEVDSGSFLAMKLFASPALPPFVNDYDVPILRYKTDFLQTLPWDLSIKHFLGFIDGITYVKKLSSSYSGNKVYTDADEVNNDIDMGMDKNCIKRCLRVLMLYNCVLISDILQFSNIYYLDENTPSRIENDTSNVLLREIQLFCATDPCSLPMVEQIVKILLNVRPGYNLKYVIEKYLNPSDLSGIDLRRLLAIAQEKKLIYRMHEYPHFIGEIEQLDPNQINQNTINVLKHLDGRECLDAICCKFELSHQDVIDMPNVIIVYK
jgi:hypothetical protein